MSLKASASKLNQTMKDLNHAWGHTREQWRDSRRQSFEQQYMIEVGPCVKSALVGMSHMDELLAQARRDCE